MGKTYKDNPNKWRNNKNRPQKPWKKQKGNRPAEDKPRPDEGLDSEGSPRW